jgi:transposase, IS5 family
MIEHTRHQRLHVLELLPCPCQRRGDRGRPGTKPLINAAHHRRGAGDRGFASAKNEDAAVTRGVRRVILPRPGRKTPARRVHERQRWFRRGQRWRVGCEGRISVIKRRHGLRRCRYHGADGTARWVGLGVIANNLVSAATFLHARATA